MKFNWTVEENLFITDDEMKDIVSAARDYMHYDYEQDEAIEEAIRDYLAGQDGGIFYTITDEVLRQIENEIKKLLT